MHTATATRSQEAADLAAFTTDALLTAIIQLTHRIHTASAEYVSLPTGCTPGEVASLRAQRSAARAEVLRRAGA